MRHLLAMLLVCAVGAPAAYALPSAGANALALAKSDPITQVSKRAKGGKSRKGGGGGAASGIHPLVGSGGY